ncbi:FUSC family protein [Nitratifractor sp.]
MARAAEQAVSGLRWRTFLPTAGLSSHARFALKTALAITIAYMVPLAMGWGQPTQGVVAIMVIASAGLLLETLGKGVMRIVGTVAGAIVGLGLIALFPQDRFAYFLALSIVSAVVIYLYHAYRGDTTFWMIMLVVMVMIFSDGKVDDRLIYAVDRAWTTAFGIFVYAMVNLYLWPERHRESRVAAAESLAGYWSKLHSLLWKGGEQGGEEERDPSLELGRLEQALEVSLRNGTTEYPGGIAFDTARWSRLWPIVRSVDGSLSRLLLLDLPARRAELERVAPQTEGLWREIGEMIDAVKAYWREPAPLEPPPERKLEIEGGSLEGLPVLERAELLSLATEIERLHGRLRELLLRLDRILSPEPDAGELLSLGRGGAGFHWGDLDHLLATLTSLLIFWTGLALWIYANLPQGYMVASLAFVLSLVVLFTPINPLALILVFSLSFLVSFLSYVWILPRLHQGWELALYIFGYMFAAYYFIRGPAALFFALGLIFQFIGNTMNYNFQLFIILLLVFYLFLGLLLIFNYLPFPNRPERFFLKLEERLQRYMARLLRPLSGEKGWRRWLRAHARAQLPVALAKAKLWSGQIDYGYFTEVEKEKLAAYLKMLERFATLQALLATLEGRIGSVLAKLPAPREGEAVERRLWQAAFSRGAGEIRDGVAALEASLARRLEEVEWERFSREELTDLAEYLTLRTKLWEAYLDSRKLRKEIPMDHLRWSRF